MSSLPEHLPIRRRPLHRSSRSALPARSSGRSPRTVVAWLAGRRAVRWGALWGLVIGVYIAESAIAYQAVGATPEARARLAQTWSSNHAMAALFGPAFRIDTNGGFTAWRSLGTLTLLAATIGLLLGTSVLRGEEESGRWELLVAGQTTRAGAARQALAGLAAGLVAMFGVAAVVAVGGGRRATVPVTTTGLLEISLSAVLTAAVFIALGVFAGQLAATRRQAASLSAAVLGAAYLIRFTAESVSGLRWTRWVTPLGWPSLLHAATSFRPLALVPPIAVTAVLAAASLAIAGRRDLNASVLPDPESAAPRMRLLTGQFGLSVRMIRVTAVSWFTGQAALGFVTGIVAQSDSESTSGSQTVNKAMARLGAHRTGAEADLGLSLMIGAVLVSFAAATIVNATRREEADGLLDNLLVGPVGRTRWLLSRVALAAALALGCGLAAGLAAWAGADVQHMGIGVGTMAEAGLNMVPPALVLVGIGTLVHALVPRATATAVYALLGWSFLMQLLGSFAGINHWLLDTSILHHSTPAPAADPNWAGAGVMTVLAACAVAAAVVVFRRRDLAGQ
ncbi:MAG: hypothetical protein HOW97_31950 [Catenulispora sp.]|nr:hypothetical protein [Catenulispora sp.]